MLNIGGKKWFLDWFKHIFIKQPIIVDKYQEVEGDID